MKKVRCVAVVFVVLLTAGWVTAESDLNWLNEGWCAEEGQGQLSRRNLPPWVCEAAYRAKLHSKYSVYLDRNPFFITADLNGDGKLDAAVWVTEIRTKKSGLAIFHQGKRGAILLAAGTRWEEGRGDDFGSLERWSVISRGEVLDAPHWERRKVKLVADALVLMGEASAFAVYWDGKKYRSYQLTD